MVGRKDRTSRRSNIEVNIAVIIEQSIFQADGVLGASSGQRIVDRVDCSRSQIAESRVVCRESRSIEIGSGIKSSRARADGGENSVPGPRGCAGWFWKR